MSSCCTKYVDAWACLCEKEQFDECTAVGHCGGKPANVEDRRVNFLCPEHEDMRRDEDAAALSKGSKTAMFNLDANSEYAQALRKEHRLLDAEYYRQYRQRNKVVEPLAAATCLLQPYKPGHTKVAYRQLVDWGIGIPPPELRNPHSKQELNKTQLKPPTVADGRSVNPCGTNNKRRHGLWQSTPKEGSSAISKYAKEGEDWTQISDPKERRRLQQVLYTRKYGEFQKSLLLAEIIVAKHGVEAERAKGNKKRRRSRAAVAGVHPDQPTSSKGNSK